MKNKLLAIAGAATFALAVSASASYAGYMQPGETMGVSLDSPLPEGVFFADLEDYGRQDVGGQAHTGVNIPVILWSTPFTFNNTRLEFLAALPFAHLDGQGLDRVGAITYAFGPILAHDFGNGLTGGISAFVRTPSPSTNLSTLDGRTTTEGDFRESLQYVIPGSFAGLGGLTFIENGSVTSALGQPNFTTVNDFFAGDFTLEKTFDKLTVGFTGFGNTDLENRANAGGRVSRVELGGLLGYDFGKFTLTGIVTRSVLETVNGVNAPRNYETRGWLRLIVPLYVAPTAPAPVVARY